MQATERSECTTQETREYYRTILLDGPPDLNLCDKWGTAWHQIYRGSQETCCCTGCRRDEEPNWRRASAWVNPWTRKDWFWG